jgi:hypothetical protein
VFPNYYSFSQDLTFRHQGKVTGTLGCFCWLAMAAWHEFIGQCVQGRGLIGGPIFQGRGSYGPCFVIAGVAPLVGFAALLLLWGPTAPPEPVKEPAVAPAPVVAVATRDEAITVPAGQEVMGAQGRQVQL